MSSRESVAADIFIEAVEQHEPAEWPAFIDEACGSDEQLRERVEILLKAHDESNLWFDSDRSLVSLAPPITEGPGTVIGSYKLMEKIGEGGMGVVYVAQQLSPMRRRVAFKVIKPGMDTKEVISRFTAERQALALMDHPNIAKVHDAGTTDSGRPYFVMELVRGIPITEYCDLNRLNARQQLELFVHMCHAVQHAHQKGVIHRDLKPSNVLITEHDGTPVVKVIDFGVAKAINQQLTERTIYTRHQQMVGTPMYMSPEQAELSGLDVDTRSDIYSLGVLLYELLTGTTPFDKQRLSEAAYDEIRRIIREEEPSKPSTKVRTLGKTASSVSGYRDTDPDKLSQLLRGDLDWIVMKSLEKDRSRRYETANGLARDIERYLNDEPVMASPPSAVYRFHKFARRNTAAMVTLALVTTTLVLGVAVSTWQAIRADAQRARAVAAEQEANVERDRAIEAEQAEREQRLRAQEQAYVADMNMAHQAWEAGDVDGMTRVLKRYQFQPNQKDLRGFQWRHLWYLCQRSRNTPFLAHGSRILSMDISPDDQTVATIGYSAFLKLWDIRSQRLLQEIPGPWLVASTAFSPDGKHVAYGRPGAMILRDLSRGSENRRYPCGSGTFSSAFSPDGTRLAAAGFGETVYLWNLESDESLALKGHDFLIWKVAFSPDGRTLASAGSYEVILWDVESGEKRHVLPMDASPAPVCRLCA